MSKNKAIYFKNLDGLRAFAALSVLFYHSSHWFKIPHNSKLYYFLTFGEMGGAYGVQFFLILSGFLITYLLYVEQNKNKKINILQFYIRRILRVWPLYYLTLIVGFYFYPIILEFVSGQTYIENASIFLYSVFAVNFDFINHGGPSIGILGVQWSIAIEEQFYLIWPLFFYMFFKSKYFPLLLIIVTIFSEIFYLQNINTYIGYYHFYSNIRFLAFGGFISYVCYFNINLMNNMFNRIGYKKNIFIYLICITLLFLNNFLALESLNFNLIFEVIPILFFTYIILEQNYSKNSFVKLGNFKMLNWLGKISYGIYIYHMIIIYFILNITDTKTDPYLIKTLITTILTILVSHISYLYFENYFIKLKSKF